MSTSKKIEWSDAMLTGVDEMDSQHHILVDTLSELSTRLAENSVDPMFDRVTRDLLAYAIYHFDTEELLMQQYSYAAAAPDHAARHLAAHRGFAERVVKLRDDARTGRPGADVALLRFLESWLVDHIMTIDKRLGEFVCSHRKPDDGTQTPDRNSDKLR